ncbi:hypothetical protein D521_1634 [beta proteobacterium CB]|nr:hypothetical protein D521_1634 [beta proteobacterium CB]
MLNRYASNKENTEWEQGLNSQAEVLYLGRGLRFEFAI